MPFVRRAGRFVQRISALELSEQVDLIKGAIIPSSSFSTSEIVKD